MTGHESVGFTSDNGTQRGTVSLLWQCLSTIFLCVYVTVHFDVPVRPLSTWATFVRKFIFVLIMIIAPELLPFNAFNEWYRARLIQRAWNAALDMGLSLKQVHFIMSGGLQISVSTSEHYKMLELEFLILVDREGLTPSDSRKAQHQNFQLFWESVLRHLPSDREVDDRSKSDFVGKAVTCIQAGNVLALIVGRLADKLDVSLLEVATASYIILALVSYIFWFRKPYNLATYQTMELPFALTEISLDWQKYNLANLSSEPREHLKRRGRTEINANNLATGSLFTGSLMEEEFYPPSKSARTNKGAVQLESLLSLVLLCSVLAGIHLAAWNYAFPSTVEAWLWRISCLVIGGLPWYLIYAQQLQAPFESILPPAAVRLSQFLSTTFMYFIYTSYVVARVFLIVETFVSLRAAPKGIYQQPDWTEFLGRIF